MFNKFSSQLKASAAHLLTRGEIPRIAEEVRLALSNSVETSKSGDLEDIVSHAVRTVPFYRSKGGVELEDLPVVDKDIMRGRPCDFFQVGVRQDQLRSASTSGSTGTPFTAFFDAGKVMRHRGGLVGTYQFMGGNPYGPVLHSKFWPPISNKDRMMFALKGQLPYSGADDGLVSPLRAAEWIKRNRGVTIMGYSSYVEGLMKAFKNMGLKFDSGEVAAVIGGSEPASSVLWSEAQDLFGLVPHMRYSNNEIGMIAVTGEDPETYHVDTSSFYVEILEENSDVPVRPGELGRIVVTDLYNRAMPFLRYDTGDLGRFPLDSQGREIRGQITDILGRRLEVLVSGTKEAPLKAHPLQITRGAMNDLTEVRQFQLKQRDIGKFTWILNAEESDALERRLRSILDERVGNIVECIFEYVEEVPVMASGKRQFFINEIPNYNDLF